MTLLVLLPLLRLRFTLWSQTSRVGYAVSWYSTTSLAHAKIRKRCRILGTVHPRPACPCSPPGLGFSAFPLRRPALVVLSFLSVGTWCRKILPLFWGARRRVCVFPWFLSYTCLSLRVGRKVLLRLAFVLGAMRGEGGLWVRGV